MNYRITLRYLWIAIVLVGVMGTSWSAMIIRGPYLQLQTDTSILVSWNTDTDTPCQLDWGKGKTWLTKHVKTSSGLRHDALVTGLKPDQAYYYQIQINKKPVTELITFRTAPASTSKKLSFTTVSDSRSNPKICKAVYDRLLPETMNGFCITMGDLAGRGEDKKTDYWQKHYFEPVKEIINQVCLYPCIGNHELYNEDTPIHYVYPKGYEAIFNLPAENSGNELYYSFDKGPVHFICLDVFWSPYTTGSDQYNWFIKDLEKTTKNIKIVFMHAGPFNSANNKDIYIKPIRSDLVPLFEKYRVDLVFSGHYDYYQHNVVNGVNYIVQGTGGEGLQTSDNSQPYNKSLYNGYCFNRIDIDGNTINCKTINIDGQVVDTFQIIK